MRAKKMLQSSEVRTSPPTSLRAKARFKHATDGEPCDFLAQIKTLRSRVSKYHVLLPVLWRFVRWVIFSLMIVFGIFSLNLRLLAKRLVPLFARSLVDESGALLVSLRIAGDLVEKGLLETQET